MQYVQFYLRNGLLGTKRTGVIVTLFEKQTLFLKTYPTFEKVPLTGKKEVLPKAGVQSQRIVGTTIPA